VIALRACHDGCAYRDNSLALKRTGRQLVDNFAQRLGDGRARFPEFLLPEGAALLPHTVPRLDADAALRGWRSATGR